MTNQTEGQAPQEHSAITRLIHGFAAGNKDAAGELFQLVYSRLHSIAERTMSRGQHHTLQPTALIHEAYCRMENNDHMTVANREHFFALAAKAMRHTLFDYHRGQNREKRGGGAKNVGLDQVTAFYEGRGLDVVRVHLTLEELAKLDEEMATLVELKVYGLMTTQEIANHLGLSVRKVERKWTAARIWLQDQLGDGDASSSAEQV